MRLDGLSRGESMMLHASLYRPRHPRALILGAGLLILGGFLVGPFNAHRAAGQAKTDKTEPAKTQPDPKVTAGDTVIGGGVEQIAYINQQLDTKWKDNKLKPADRCTDYEFIRRVTLDIIGRIAKPSEIKEYMGWSAELRRSKLVDKLLKSEEYANNFANLWSNLLMTRTGIKKHHEQMQAWLTEEFMKNDCNWAKIVTSLLSATGKENGDGDEPAVNFILAHLGEDVKGSREENGRFEMVPVTSRITRLFLGLRTQCTQCHDHPFNDEWKQENFWGINGYLRQVDAPQGRPVAKQNNKMGKPPILTLVDDANFNKSSLVPYERRSGLVEFTKPFFLDGTKMAGDLKGKTRRQELAQKVTTSDYFAKEFVNRMWGHFFGRGFTKDVDDFGDHSPVSHPELLDKLAKDWATKFQHNPRDIIRWICNSKAYGLSSHSNPTNDKADTDQYFSRMLLKAMTPEQLFDSLMTATEAKEGQNREKKRELRDKWMNKLVVSFGDDEGNEGTFNGTVVQALLMMNGQEINDAIVDDANGTMATILKHFEAYKKTGVVPKKLLEAAITDLYLHALNRPPHGAMKKTGKDGKTVTVPPELERLLSPERMGLDAPNPPRVVDYAFARLYCQDVFWALLNSNEFILNH
jgi:hypothetical protein